MIKFFSITLKMLSKSREALILLMLGDAAVSVALGLTHMPEQVIPSFFYLAFGAIQLTLLAALFLRPVPRAFLAACLGNTLFVLGSVLFYIVGLPGGQNPWTPQPLGAAELSSLIMAVLATLIALRLWRSSQQTEQGRTPLTVRGRVISFLVVILFSWIGVASAINAHPDEMNMSAPVPPGQQAISITSLHQPPGAEPVKTFTLAAEQSVVSGNTIWSYNGTVPGPEIRVNQGDRLRVTFVNHLPVATSVHWHGIRLPNAEDGVAGVTQDAVPPGGSYTYEFVVKDAGTFMYHAHQDTFNQMLKGLYGPLVVNPAGGPTTDRDYTVVLSETPGGNSFGPGMTGYLALGKKEMAAFNGQSGNLQLDAMPGDQVRLRLIGAVQGEPDGFPNYMIAAPREVVLMGAPYRVAAIDGNDINEPQTIGPERIRLGIGQRYDLVFSMPSTGQVRLVDTNGQETVTFGAGGTPTTSSPGKLPLFDITNYGQPTTDSILAAKNGQFDVTYPMDLDIRSGLREDKMELVQTINGNASPMMTQYVVKQGQLVHFHIVNKSEEFHTIHLHGHTFTVVAHQGHPIQGSPIHLDSLPVGPYDDWDIAFLADNPGLWMIHCHVLVHAAFGMSAMLVYEGYTTPYTIGAQLGNKPE